MMKRLPIFFATLLAVLLSVTATASAHGDEGEVNLTKADQTGPTTVYIQAGVLYKGDGHLAEDAEVSATLSSPSGATVGPTVLTPTNTPGTDSSGVTAALYDATFELPSAGDWSITLTSQNPSAETDGQFTLAESFDTTSASSEPVTLGEDAAPGTMTAEDQVQADKDELITSAAETQQVAKDAEGSKLSLYLIIGAAIGFVLAFVLARKQRKEKNSKASVPTPTD
jgi:hypothetical protein